MTMTNPFAPLARGKDLEGRAGSGAGWLAHCRCAMAVAATVWGLMPVRAVADVAPQGVVTLAASASVEVVQDVLSVTMSATRDGADAGAVQAALKQALDAALAQARRVARPGQLEVSAGNFSLYPRYAPAGTRGGSTAAAGAIVGWQGSTELRLEGRDMQAIAQLTGRIDTMTIARVAYSLSREQREAVETEVAAQAIARYRASAADYARQFGYTDYVIREVNISTDASSRAAPIAMARAEALTSAAAPPLPVQAGHGSVTVHVSGSVQLTRTVSSVPGTLLTGRLP